MSARASRAGTTKHTDQRRGAPRHEPVVDLSGAQDVAILRGMFPRPLLVLLLVVNVVVLLGQLWPEGAPPFARIVNIAFLIATLVLFARLVLGGRRAA